MSDVRCPMCGKPSPAGQEVCQFCQARLKPLWISTKGDNESSIQSQPPDQKSTENAGADLPDWLASLRQRQGSEDSTPEWLREEDSSSESVDADLAAPAEDFFEDAPKEELTAQDGEEAPDWLAELRENPRAQQETGAEAFQDDRAPDWFASLDSGAEQTAQENQQESEQIESNEAAPDWLENIRANQRIDPLDEPDMTGPVETGPGFQVEAESEDESGRSTPEWLTEGLRGDTFLQSIGESEEPDPVGVSPSSMGGIEPVDLGPLDEGDIPNWLAGTVAGLTALEPGAQEAGNEGDVAPIEKVETGLSPAELPNWLEAMRPVDTAAFARVPEEGREQVESAGPLSGLRGVLPAEPDVSKIQKPPAYTTKLNVTEAHQTNAALLEQMIQHEGEPKPIPRRPAITSLSLLRIAIAAILFVTILWPLVTGTPQVGLPEIAGETGIANQLINQVTEGAPVLLAVEYEPGFTGEMEAIATNIVDHLMLKGAYLALVSSTPTGPAQAERLVDLVNQRGNHSYLPGRQYDNLGFIPGGPAALLNFAESPQQAVPYAISGEQGFRRVWESGPLASVAGLEDFRLIIVLTENPDTARSWIEQVQPALENTPLLMATSAQADPLVRPYYAAYPRQVQGLVSGLLGGSEYESLNGRSGLSSAYWNAFSLSLLVAAALILAGGVIYAVIGALAPANEAGGDK